MSIKRLSDNLLKIMLSDDLASPVYTCPACGEIGFAFDHVKAKGHNRNNLEACRVCGLPSYRFRYGEVWKTCWQENGAKTVFEMPMAGRMEYVDHIYDCMYRKEYFILSDEDIKNKRLDRRLFTDNQRRLDFVKDDSKLTITNDKGEKWEFPYETNRIFELDDDKRYVMLIEECRYARHLASDYLAVRESPLLNYPGLTPDLFTFVGVFNPDCVFEDREGTVYTANVAKSKREVVFEDDDFHKHVTSLCCRINDIRDAIPADNFQSRNLLLFVLTDLELMDSHGDPSRYIPKTLTLLLEERPDILENNLPPIRELASELKEAVREYKDLKRV